MSDATPPPDDIAGLRAEIGEMIRLRQSRSPSINQMASWCDALATLSARIEALEAMLRETVDKGLIYWEPQTARGAAAKADMEARIAALLSSEADHER